VSDPSSAPVLETPLRLPEAQAATLPNGLEVVVAQRRGLPLAVARLELWAGASLDPAGREGLADFAAQLLRRGTRKRKAEAIDDAIERAGGSLGVDVDHDSMALSLSLPSEHLGVALDVLADLLMNPSFPAAEVQAARRRTLGALATDLDDPSTVADKMVSHALMEKHPYGHPIGGWKRSVSKFDRSEAVRFHRATFRPQLAHLFVVGDVDPASAHQRVERCFGRWAGDSEPVPPLEAPAAAPRKRVLLVDKADASQTQLRIATVGIARGDPRYIDCTVASAVLGGGFTSRLMQEIRVNRGLSYGASSRFYAYRYGGEFVLNTFTKNETVGECVEVLLDVCQAFATKGPTEEELQRTATYLTGLFPLQLETNEQVARMLADLRLYGLGEDYVTRFRERVRGVNVSAAQAAAGSYFPTEAYVLVAVGPAKQLKKQLAPWGTVEVMPLEEAE
jgi:zinc protease